MPHPPGSDAKQPKSFEDYCSRLKKRSSICFGSNMFPAACVSAVMCISYIQWTHSNHQYFYSLYLVENILSPCPQGEINIKQVCTSSL